MEQNNENLYQIELIDPEYDLGKTGFDGNNMNMSPDEALVECINKYGAVDLYYMSDISGKSAYGKNRIRRTIKALNYIQV